MWSLIAPVCAVAANCELGASHAADLSTLAMTPVQSPNYIPAQVDFIASWLDMVSQTQAAQPHWMTPLITITPRLEQKFRYDTYFMNEGNGSRIDNYGGGEAVEFILTYETEVSMGVPPLGSMSR